MYKENVAAHSSTNPEQGRARAEKRRQQDIQAGKNLQNILELCLKTFVL
jgi:hypothetical protein